MIEDSKTKYRNAVKDVRLTGENDRVEFELVNQ
jgi:hypothetical protein